MEAGPEHLHVITDHWQAAGGVDVEAVKGEIAEIAALACGGRTPSTGVAGEGYLAWLPQHAIVWSLLTPQV